MVVGRIAVGVLMLVSGGGFNAVQLLLGNDYSGFSDPGLFGWVTDAWEAVVPGNHVLLIGLLVLFEATVGALILSGGPRTQVGYLGAIAFHCALWLFGWFEAVYVMLMLPALVLLLRAERRAGTGTSVPTGTPPVDLPRRRPGARRGADTDGPPRAAACIGVRGRRPAHGAPRACGNQMTHQPLIDPPHYASVGPAHRSDAHDSVRIAEAGAAGPRR